MLTDVHDILREMIYERGQIDPGEIDVRFETPTREWVGRLVRPTINFFLFGLKENADLRQTSFQSTRVNGRAERRMPPRRIDVRYMVSAHTTDAGDEHRLIWRVLVTLLKYPELPDELLPEELRQSGLPLAHRVAQPGDDVNLLEVWGALGNDPHPAFSSVMTISADLDVAMSSPLVLTRTLRFDRTPSTTPEHTETRIGGIVRDRDNMPLAGVTVALDGSAMAAVTNVAGEFTLGNVPAGPVRFIATSPSGDVRTIEMTVPSETYDIVLH